MTILLKYIYKWLQKDLGIIFSNEHCKKKKKAIYVLFVTIEKCKQMKAMVQSK